MIMSNMERDLNHLLSQGYSTRELLVAVLHMERWAIFYIAKTLS
jgi:hypothetical protein